MMQAFDLSEACSQELDRVDPLARFRERFCIPKGTIYMDGNSLGPLSRDAETALLATLDEWRRLGVRGWLEAERPWFHYAERLGAMAASLVGAAPDEVVMTGTTTVNIHALVSTFFQPEGKRRKILANEGRDIGALIAELRETCDALAGDDSMQDMAEPIRKGLDELEQGVAWLAQNAVTNPLAAATASFNILMLAGTVLGGAFLARTTLAARIAGDMDAAFIDAKVATTRFYCAHMLPRSSGYLAAAQADPAMTMAIPAEAL